MTPTLVDIARETKTSVSTVSRVLSGGDAAQRISPETRHRVVEAASRLGLPATRVLPYQAQLCFERGDYAQARALVHALGPWDALPRLRPVIEYWNAP